MFSFSSFLAIVLLKDGAESCSPTLDSLTDDEYQHDEGIFSVELYAFNQALHVVVELIS